MPCTILASVGSRRFFREVVPKRGAAASRPANGHLAQFSTGEWHETTHIKTELDDLNQTLGSNDSSSDEKEDSPDDSSSNKRLSSPRCDDARQRRLERARAFILEEAEEDDDEDSSEDEGSAGENGLVDASSEEDGPSARDIDRACRGEDLHSSQRDGDLLEYLRMKYGGEEGASRDEAAGAAGAANAEGEDAALAEELERRRLLPGGGASDPRLWTVRCRAGEERSAVVQLLRAALRAQPHFHSQPLEPLRVYAAVARQGLRGHVYVEALRQTHVKTAAEAVGALRLGLWHHKMVPLKEMPDALRIIKHSNELHKGEWVRVKSGLYRNDAAVVEDVDLAQSQVLLRLLPRIDYSKRRFSPRGTPVRAARRAEPEPSTVKGKKKRKLKRPEAKPFNPSAIKGIGGEITYENNFLVFEGNRYSKSGFLFKKFPLKAIVKSGVRPSLAEVEQLQAWSSALAEGEAEQQRLEPGDSVAVRAGELAGLRGEVARVEGSGGGAVITVAPRHPELKVPLDFLASELRKEFRAGDHVQVANGAFKGESGFVVRVEEHRVVLLSDSACQEVEVLPQDLQKSCGTVSTVAPISSFQLGDVVQLDSQTVGIVVSVKGRTVNILSMYDKIIEAKPQSLHKKGERGFVFAPDANCTPVHKHDYVKVVDGRHTGRNGEVKFLFGEFAFLHSNLYEDNGGYFVCKTSQVVLPGSKGCLESNGGLANPASPRGMRRGGGGGGSAGSSRDANLIGKTVQIIKGHFKGGVGVVRDATARVAWVELHAGCQSIAVDRARVVCVGARATTPLATPFTDTSTPYATPYATPCATPFSSTPCATPCSTPFATPLYRDGSSTPYTTPSDTPRLGAWTPSHCGSCTPSDIFLSTQPRSPQPLRRSRSQSR